MNRLLTLAAAALMIGGSVLVGCDKSNSTADNRSAGEKTRDAVANTGQKTGDALGNAIDKTAAATQPSADAAIKDTRSTLAAAVEDAVTHNDFNKLVDRLSKADRDRIGSADKNSLADLNAAIGKFRDDWKAKYNQDFKLSDKEQVVFGTPVAIQVGDAAEARLAAASNPPVDTSAKNGKDAANNLTTVTLPAVGAAAPAISLTLRNEGTITKSYKIDVPDTLDQGKLKANLIKQINAVDGMKDQWPNDVNEAARVVSQHILAALTDTAS